MKLIYAIVNSDDSPAVAAALTKEGYLSTRLASMGNFLTMGNVTFLIASESAKVEKAIEIINDIKANLPGSIAEAKRLVSARDEFIGNAKREAEAVRKSAEESARAMVEEQEIVRAARAKSAELIEAAEARANELRRVASEYVNDIIARTEAGMNEALQNIRQVHTAFQNASGTAAKEE